MTDPETQQATNQALEHQRLNRLDDAEDVYRRVLSQNANQPKILNNLANILKDSGRIEEAVELCRRAVELDPTSPEIHSSLCYKLLFHPDADRAAIYQEQSNWNKRHGSSSPSPCPPRAQSSGNQGEGRGEGSSFSPSPGPPLVSAGLGGGRILRIGYVSPDFYGHAECFFVLPLLKSHDRNQFEVHCYSSTINPDKATDLIRSVAGTWHEVRDLTNDQLASKIRRDRIDILIDLTMHMANNRLPMFAQKPAPIQATWLAYPGGTGLTAMDYRLTDNWLDPPGTDRFYSERSIRLPDGWCCYNPLGDVPPAAPRSPSPVTFGCLNNPAKLNRPTLNLWTKVLASVKDSRLLLLTESARQRHQIAETFAAAGIDPTRINFTTHRRRGEYLRLYDQIDVCLDPLIYHGITTTLDALWMAVPVLTLPGQTAPARAGLSILSNLGMPELIAGDDAQFITLATNLAADFPRRSQLRATLRDRMLRSPLMDAPRFARNVEAAYRALL